MNTEGELAPPPFAPLRARRETSKALPVPQQILGIALWPPVAERQQSSAIGTIARNIASER